MTSIHDDDELGQDEVPGVKAPPQRFSHISIGTTTPGVVPDSEDFEEEEIIDVGAVPGRYPRSEEKGYRETIDDTVDEAVQHGDFEEEVDFGVDDLPPMPVAQKVVLFFVILMIVIAVFNVVRYWFGV
ncbi:MAG: hypothetical protein HGA54_00565 [Actinobacteria bacterium]|nr:hypothetical protein [Actinomycetota bacterium]